MSSASRRTLAGAATAAAGVSFAELVPAATWLGPVRRLLAPDLAGLGTPGHVALTFDDGPHPAGTPAVLAAAGELGWQATFFMLGSEVRARPALAAAVADAGHEVALHGDAHRYAFTRSHRGMRDDLARGIDAVQAATGARPRWFRPPYGVLTAGALAAARGLGLRPLLWSAWGREWRAGATPRSVMTDLRRGVLDGGTVLLHDSDVVAAPGAWRITLRTLPLLAEELARRGLRAGPVADHGLPSPTTHR